MTKKQVEDLLTNMVGTLEKQQTMITMNITVIAKCSECIFKLQERINKLESKLLVMGN